MRRLLFLVLLAIAFCTVVEKTEDPVVLQAADIIDIWNQIKHLGQQAVDWLKAMGLWDPIVNFLKTTGRSAAIGWCSTKVPAVICSSIVDFILSYIN